MSAPSPSPSSPKWASSAQRLFKASTSSPLKGDMLQDALAPWLVLKIMELNGRSFEVQHGAGTSRSGCGDGHGERSCFLDVADKAIKTIAKILRRAAPAVQ